MIRRVALWLSVAALMMAVTACGASGAIAKPAPEQDKETFVAEGGCEAALRDGDTVLHVSGTSNLMDGTSGVISVLGADGTKLSEHRFTQAGGEVEWDFEVADDWPGVIYSFISYGTQNMDSQPREVTDVYGRRFQNLEGPDVIWDLKGCIVVFQSEEVEIPR